MRLAAGTIESTDGLACALDQELTVLRRTWEPLVTAQKNLHPAALMRAEWNVSYCARRAGPPQFSVHFAAASDQGETPTRLGAGAANPFLNSTAAPGGIFR
jgi:hypothetical protein